MTKRTIATSVCFCALTASSLLQANDAYLVRNLVSDIPDLADFTDPHLQGAWGISESPGSPFWISDAGSGFSTLYTTSGSVVPLVVAIAPSKASGASAAGSPTGTVWNSSNGGFQVNGKSAPFLFATFDGTIQAWSPAIDGAHSQVMVDNSASGAEYFGLAMASDPLSGNTFLYAANFHSGQIEVFDENYKPIPMPGGFRDPAIPSNYAPFNIQALKGNLYVAYAQQNSSQTFSNSGPGLGYVDVFAPNGVMVQQLAAKGPLNAPWGLAIAPVGFGDFAGDVLVGNFGDGTINAFNAKTGAFVAQLNDSIGAPINIPSLWALQAGNGKSGGEAAAIYFTAGIPGPDNGNHGLFGRLHAAPQLTVAGLVNAGNAQGGIAPNTWVAIMGWNVAETTRSMNSGDVVSGALATEIDGVSVTINGEAAYVDYVSPTQVNVLTPTDLATGSVNLQLDNHGLVSNTVAITVQALAPAFFPSMTTPKYIMATHSDGTAVGPTAPAPNAASPARPGETIWLYGTGFGPTNPATPNGMVITTPLPLATMPTVMIGGATASVTSANLQMAGTYQIAVVVPSSAKAGDVSVTATAGGVTSPAGLIPVQ